MSGITSLSPAESGPPPVRILGAFGVGCFHFGLKAKSAVTAANYADQLGKHLGNYPNIDQIKIDGCDDWEADLDRVTGDGEDEEIGKWSLNNADGIYPWPTHGKVSFRVYLPNTIRDKLSSQFGGSPRGNTFDVSIYYRIYGLPVAIIESNSKKEFDPSFIVIITREYLEQHAPASSDFMFQSLGPSPFHADFF
jgi:hypothetical protein